MKHAAAILVLLATLVLPAVPASAQEGCGPAGGAGVQPATAPPGDFRITGGGWGHGAGMSQYGAQGAGRLGCDAETILRTYYPGVSVEQVPMPPGIRVSLDVHATSTVVTGVSGSVPWETCLNGICTEIPGLRLEPGRSWRVDLLAGGVYRIRDGETERWRGGDRFTLLRARLSLSGGDDRIVRVGNRYKWGLLEFDSVQPSNSSPYMFINLDIAPFDRYLYGLAEVPSSWPEQTLQAQVIAARSYALLRRERYGGAREDCRCDVYATVRDQAYSGYEKESEGSSGQFGARWRAAVDATRAPDFSAARVLRYGGATADAFYSSSHGGYSESSRFVFGGELPYLRPVDDSRWDRASDNPYRSWAVTVSADRVGQAFGVGTAQSVEVLDPKGHACRVGERSRGFGGVRIRGTTGERVVGGNEFRRALGLRSTLFAVNADAGGGCPAGGPAGVPGQAPPAPPPPPPPAEPPGVPVPPVASPLDPVLRVAGSERIGTAIEVARKHWPSAADAVVATAADFADALSASALAAQLDAPLLLVPPADLPGSVVEELRRLAVQRVVLLGGTAAVAPGVEGELQGAGFQVRRLAGNDRYATAAAVAAEVTSTEEGEVALMLGTGYADALAAGALAASPDRMPVLLTLPDRLPQVTTAALAELEARKVLVVGGEAAIAPAVAVALADLGYQVERVAGADRFATSAAAARVAMARFGEGERPVVLATGFAFPDALAAAALAARLDAALALVHGADLNASPATRDFLAEYAASLTQGVLVGGTGAVGDLVVQQAAEAITAD